MNRTTSRGLVHAALAVLLALVLCGCHPQAVDPGTSQEEPELLQGVTTQVIRVVDGDTIIVELADGLPAAGDHVTVRLLGIDAPETNSRSGDQPDCGATQATEHLEGLLPTGTWVKIVADPRADRVDRYSRVLGYVERAFDGADAALRQVQAGYAGPWFPKGEPQPQRYPSYKKAATASRAQATGLYQSCPGVPGRG